VGIKRLFHNIGAFFGRIFGADQAKRIQDLLINKLLPIAIEAVTEAEALAGVSGRDKQTAAYSHIVNELGAAAKDIKGSLINLAIEVALAKLQGVFGN
jgi:hypothetical protein